ncbi:MAG TPA: DinB family protein [Saprospiraceae bacterium]|nr:DinB family protein [Saprospiraceae bacterium]
MDKLILLSELEQYNANHLLFVQSLQSLDNETLQSKKEQGSWNTLECVEHLKRYGDFYLPVISDALHKAKDKDTNGFISGWLGDYFAKAMLPGSNKMNTFKSKNPIGEHIEIGVIDQFLNQLYQMAQLLETAKSKDLSSIKVKTTIPLAKINVGDALRVVIYHNERHIKQIQDIINAYKTGTLVN